ncbi:beta-N-acetylhexosaminidase [Paenibacillus chartarius]|uniref:beta-N-acetylhexosaminidase n=1 Tax=Paenibacillus chartarius TaxID=747481 RepID=A0ABV6DN64_9BACL
MTLEEKIGQLLLVGFEGTEPSSQIVRLIRKHRVGGVIYFARNVRNKKQLAELSDALQQEAREAGTLPLWISIDQEGGMVARITDGVALMPGAMALAAGGSLDDAYEVAHITGKELRALGINLNYAPVLDVNNNARNPVIGVRSFGESPDAVAAFGAATVRGLQDAGVAATAKHFPGHGDTETDSHLDLPVVPHGEERIREVELKPFVRAIEEGVDLIMSSHIYFPAFEPQRLPVTLSHRVLTGLLREELGYKGVIVTDCMEMHAISKHFGTVQAAVAAIEAGADAVLLSHTYELQTGAIEAIADAVRTGRLSEARIDASVERLLALKAKRGIIGAQEDQPLTERLAAVGTAEHLAAARRFSEKSVTVVKDGGLLPLAAEPTLVIAIEPSVVTMVDDVMKTQLTLGKALSALGFDVREELIPLTDTKALLGQTLTIAAEFDQIVVATYNAAFDPHQAGLVNGLLAAGKRPIVVATRNPYDWASFPEAPAYVCTYESRPLALESAASVLAGRIAPKGKLPVSIAPHVQAGWGVTDLARGPAE